MKKKQKFRKRLIRAVIQLLFFLLAPAVFTTAFSGIKYVFTQIGNQELIEPVSFLVILGAAVLFTIVFGRFFCGFACAFGSFGDLMFAGSTFIQKKRKKKLPRMSENLVKRLMYFKYVVLFGIVICCLLGIYGKFAGSSPWDVFSMFTAFSFKTTGYVVGIVLLILIILGMIVEERFFCKFLCPMGAVFALLPVLPFSVYRRDREKCIKGCSVCKKQCPARIDIDGDGVRTGECISCNKCLDTCPKGNIGTGIKALQGNETVFVILKGLLLLALFIWLGASRI